MFVTGVFDEFVYFVFDAGFLCQTRVDDFRDDQKSGFFEIALFAERKFFFVAEKGEFFQNIRRLKNVARLQFAAEFARTLFPVRETSPKSAAKRFFKR